MYYGTVLSMLTYIGCCYGVQLHHCITYLAGEVSLEKALEPQPTCESCHSMTFLSLIHLLVHFKGQSLIFY